MDHAAEMTMKAADKSRNYDDVTGNLYKSTAIGTYYNGSLQSIHYAPGPEPTRVTLAAGERYNLDKYYRSSFSFKDSGRRPYKGEYGEGGEYGPNAAWDELVSREHNKGKTAANSWDRLYGWLRRLRIAVSSRIVNIRERIKSVVKDFERDVFVSLGAVIDFVVEIETRFKRTDFRKLFSAA